MDKKKNVKKMTLSEKKKKDEIRRKEAAEKRRQLRFEQVIKEGGIIWGDY